MAVRNVKLGGTDWSDGNILDSADLNGTFNATAYRLIGSSFSTNGTHTTFATLGSVAIPSGTLTKFIDIKTNVLTDLATTGGNGNYADAYLEIKCGPSGAETVVMGSICIDTFSHQSPDGDSFRKRGEVCVNWYHEPTAAELGSNLILLVQGKTILGGGFGSIFHRRTWVMGV